LALTSFQTTSTARAFDTRLAVSYNPAMKVLIIYSSKHHMNTEKVALAMGAELGACARPHSRL
jgi:hypothetical protein